MPANFSIVFNNRVKSAVHYPLHTHLSTDKYNVMTIIIQPFYDQHQPSNNVSSAITTPTTTSATTSATTPTTTSATTPIRYTIEQLMPRNIYAEPPSEKVFNRLKYHKLTRRTWAEKTAKIIAHRKTRTSKRNKPEVTKHLPVIMNLNSRSICNKKEDLQQLTQDNKSDVINITETWLTKENEIIQLNQIKKDNPDYEIFSQIRTRDDVNKGGGVMILVKKSFASEITQLQLNNNNTSQLLEYIILRVNPFRKPRGFSTCNNVFTFHQEESVSTKKKK